MRLANLVYLSLLFISFLFSIGIAKHAKDLRLFPFLLLAALMTELTAYLIYYTTWLKPYRFTIYHFYIPIEYAILSYYFAEQRIPSRIKRLILTSIPVFVIISLVHTFYGDNLIKFPGINLNLSGFLIMLWSVIVLFRVEPSLAISLYKLPLFWISVGVLIYYAGGFLFNALYSYLLSNRYELSNSLNGLINKGLNYVLYLCFIYAFVCARPMKKYSWQ